MNYETREELFSRSPKHDLLQLTKRMSSLGAIPDFPEWKKTLESFQWQVDNWSQHEYPKYSYWIRRFSELEIVSVGDRFAVVSAEDLTNACQMSKENWGPWIESLSDTSQGNLWEALLGEKLVTMIPKVGSDSTCRISLMHILNEILGKVSRSMDWVDFTILLQTQFKAWDLSGFCTTYRYPISSVFGRLSEHSRRLDTYKPNSSRFTGEKFYTNAHHVGLVLNCRHNSFRFLYETIFSLCCF